MESETLREISTGLGVGESYTVLSTIKEGRLYLAARAGKRFILKTSDGSAKGIEQLKREYELSIGLSHPGLAYVFTYEEFSPVGPCIGLENVVGETLTEWLSKKRLLVTSFNVLGTPQRCILYVLPMQAAFGDFDFLSVGKDKVDISVVLPDFLEHRIPPFADGFPEF